MRAWGILGLFVVLFTSTGCTHIALERRTVKQASTLTDLQYQQVLDNLAMFACNPEAMPWHAKLKGGTVQIADQGSGGFTADIAAAAGGEVTRLIPSAGAQRGVLNQWDVEPTADADELELLRLAYTKAIAPEDPMNDEEIDNKICALSVQFDILPSEKTLRRLLNTRDAETKIGEELVKIAVKKQLAGTQLSDIKLAIGTQPNPKNPPKSKEDSDNAVKLAELKTKEAYLQSLTDELIRTELNYSETLSLVKQVLSEDAPKGLWGQPTGLAISPTAGEGLTMSNKSPLAILLGLAKEPPPLEPRGQVLLALQLICEAGYLPPAASHDASQRNVGLVAQANEKIDKLQKLLEPTFQQPWLCSGSKEDVPKCACYVGRYCNCGRQCHVWVLPEFRGVLREFNLIVLSLAPLDKQDMFPSGAAFSPSLR